jgi:beta-glucosidase
LGPHEKKTVHFKLGIDELSYWSAAKKAWTEEPAVFDVWVGGDSKASLHGSFKITQ